MVTPEQTDVVPYLTSAALIFFAQKKLKTLPLYAEFVAAMPGAAKWAHWSIAAVGSTIAALGIHVSLAGSATTGWTGAFTIPDVWSMLHAAGDWIKVYALQQWAYETTKPRPWTAAPPPSLKP